MTNQDAKYLYDAICENTKPLNRARGRSLSEADINFLVSINRLIIAGKDITHVQGLKLGEIYRRVAK